MYLCCIVVAIDTTGNDVKGLSALRRRSRKADLCFLFRIQGQCIIHIIRMLLQSNADRISTLPEGRNPASALKILQLNINLCCSNCYVHIFGFLCNTCSRIFSFLRSSDLKRYSPSQKSAAILLCTDKIRETPGGVSLTRGNAYDCTDADFPKFASLHAFLQQSVFHSAGCNAFYKVLLCGKEQNHQRHHRNEGHCHHLAPLYDRF